MGTETDEIVNRLWKASGLNRRYIHPKIDGLRVQHRAARGKTNTCDNQYNLCALRVTRMQHIPPPSSRHAEKKCSLLPLGW